LHASTWLMHWWKALRFSTLQAAFGPIGYWCAAPIELHF
jgi:hypothetical protein